MKQKEREEWEAHVAKLHQEEMEAAAKLKQEIPELELYSVEEVRALYEMYCSNWSATWLMINDGTVDQFRDWFLGMQKKFCKGMAFEKSGEQK
jgi:hypothetical protein